MAARNLPILGPRLGIWFNPLRWASFSHSFGEPERKSIESIDPTQRRVLDFITEHPGAHVREICRELGLAMGDVTYHVRRLERDRRVTSVRRGLYKFLYPSELFGDKQKEVLGILSLETPRELLLNIIDSPQSTQIQLAAAIGVTQPTASWHLKRLVELGIVERRQEGRSVTYRVGSEGEIAHFVKTYHPTVWERWSSRLADIFFAYSGEARS